MKRDEDPDLFLAAPALSRFIPDLAGLEIFFPGSLDSLIVFKKLRPLTDESLTNNVNTNISRLFALLLGLYTLVIA